MFVRKDLAALTGVAFAVLAIGGNLLQGSVPPPHADPAEAVSFYLGKPTMISAGMVVVLLGVAVLVVFLGVLRDRLAVAEGADGRLAATAFAGGIVGGTLLAGGAALNAVGGLRSREQGSISEDVAVVLFDGSFVLMGLASATGFAVAMMASAWVVLRTGLLPRWVGLLSILLAIPGLVAPVAWLMLLLVPAWTALFGSLLFLKQPTTPR